MCCTGMVDHVEMIVFHSRCKMDSHWKDLMQTEFSSSETKTVKAVKGVKKKQYTVMFLEPFSN